MRLSIHVGLGRGEAIRPIIEKHCGWSVTVEGKRILIDIPEAVLPVRCNRKQAFNVLAQKLQDTVGSILGLRYMD